VCDHLCVTKHPLSGRALDVLQACRSSRVRLTRCCLCPAAGGGDGDRGTRTGSQGRCASYVTYTDAGILQHQAGKALLLEDSPSATAAETQLKRAPVLPS
jgi:hypothetical protein